MAIYFTIKKATQVLEKMRGKFCHVLIDKADGTERMMAGQVGYSNSQASYLINEEEDSLRPALFKRINPAKVKKFIIGSREIKAGTPMRYVDMAIAPHPVVSNLPKEINDIFDELTDRPTDEELDDMAAQELKRQAEEAAKLEGEKRFRECYDKEPAK